MKDDKKELRKRVLDKLKNFDCDYRIEESHRLHDLLKRFLDTSHLSEKKIGVYFPLGEEINPLYEDRLFLFPRMNGDEIAFYPSVKKDLKPTEAFGKNFFEPAGDKEDTPEVMLIPGIAFDRLGHRLGRGKGFYDKYLSNKNIIKIGICFHDQLLVEIPYEDHDVRMDYVVSSKEVVRVIK